MVTLFVILGLVLGYIAYIIYSPVSRIEAQLRIFGKFPKWREIDSNKNGVITVSWFMGHRDNPEAVKVYEFDVKNKTSKFYTNTDDGTWGEFQGTLEDGLRKSLKKERFLSLFLSLLLGPIRFIWLLISSISIFILYFITMDLVNVEYSDLINWTQKPWYYGITGDNLTAIHWMSVIPFLLMFVFLWSAISTYYKIEESNK